MDTSPKLSQLSSTLDSAHLLGQLGREQDVSVLLQDFELRLKRLLSAGQLENSGFPENLADEYIARKDPSARREFLGEIEVALGSLGAIYLRPVQNRSVFRSLLIATGGIVLLSVSFWFYNLIQYPALPAKDRLQISVFIAEEKQPVVVHKEIELDRDWRVHRVSFPKSQALDKVRIDPVSIPGVRLQIESVDFLGVSDSVLDRIDLTLGENNLPRDFSRVGNVIEMETGALQPGFSSEMITIGRRPHFYLHPGLIEDVRAIRLRMRVIESWKSFGASVENQSE